MALSIDVQQQEKLLPNLAEIEDPFTNYSAPNPASLHGKPSFEILGRDNPPANSILRNLSLSNPNSVQASPVTLGMQNSLFSPPVSRRGVAGRTPVGVPTSSYLTGYASAPDHSSRGVYNMPGTSQADYGARHAMGAAHYGTRTSGASQVPYGTHSSPYNIPTSSSTYADPYGPGAAPSSLPNSTYLLTRGGSVGPGPVSSYAANAGLPRQASMGSGIPRSAGGSPHLQRRNQSMGGSEAASSRFQLMRQHRSLDSEFPPADPFFHPVGSGIDFPVSSSTANYATTVSGGQHQPMQQQQHNFYSSSGLVNQQGSLMTNSYSASNYGAYNQPLSVSTCLGGYGALNTGPLSNPGPSITGVNSTSNFTERIPPGAMPTPTVMANFSRDPYNMPIPLLQREFDLMRREYENTVHKLNSTMNSIKTFWSPELKKERTFRKEESGKLNLIQEQLKMSSQENQRQQTVNKQLQDELQCQYELHRTIRDTDVQSVPRDEYEALRLERDRLHRELQLARDTVRELELQIESQRQTLVSRDESIKKLLDMLQSRGQIPFNAAQEHMELDTFRSRVMELENRCRSLESSLNHKDQDIRSLQEECLNASEKLRLAQSQFERARAGLSVAPSISPGEGSHVYQGLLDAKEARIEQLERQLTMFEEELVKMRQANLTAPREFTDHRYSDAEFRDMKLKVEKAEMELNHRHTEVSTLTTRLMTTEEQLTDSKKHLEVVKEANSAKEQQLNLLQADIEALRSKLEAKNETIETKQQQVTTMQAETNRKTSEISDLNEQLKIKDGKLGMQMRKIEGLEDVVKEKERELQNVKERLQNSPAMQQQRQFQDQLEEMIRERDRLGREMREQRETLESDRIEQLEMHRGEVRDLRMAIESLQKEISDRQVLIESQNEKISDLNRELQSLRSATHLSLSDKAEGPERLEMERLNSDLHTARNECDKLLKMVKKMEGEKESLNHRIKDTQRQLDDAKRAQKNCSTSGLPYGGGEIGRRSGDQTSLEKERRIEELEEALRESVSITAERELAIAQQKQLAQQLEMKMTQYRDALNQLQRSQEEMSQKVSVLQNDKHDKDSLIRSMKHERRKHLEEVLSLKQEALVAAISEKDAHIALLEMQGSDKRPDEIHTLKKHKDKLMRKLKDENEKRMRLLNNEGKGDFGELSAGLVRDLKASPIDQEDDNEGIWA